MPDSKGKEMGNMMKASLRLALALCLALIVSGMSLALGWRFVVEASTQRVMQSYTQSRLEAIETAIEAYRSNKHSLPRSLSQMHDFGYLRLNMENGHVLDSWYHPIIYSLQGDGYSVLSYGRDGKPGGVGVDCDLSNVSHAPPESARVIVNFLQIQWLSQLFSFA